MNGRHGIIVAAAALSLQVMWTAHLHAGETPAAFDCGKDRTALALTVCSDEAAIAAERRTTVSYLAAYYALPEARRPAFRNDHTQWLNGLTSRCRRPSNVRQGDQLPSVECLRKLYTQRGDVYRKQLSGVALEESNLSPTLLKRIQTRLIELKILSGDADGVFGANTRTAIRNYQASIDHIESDFLSADERNMLLEPRGLQVQAPEPKQTLAGEATSPLEAAVPQQSEGQRLQSLDNRPFQPETTEPTVEQAPRQSASDAASSPANGNVAALVDGRSRLKTRYLIEGGSIATVILVLAVDSVFVKLRRRIKRGSKSGDADDSLSGVSSKMDLPRTNHSMQDTDSNLNRAGNTTTAPA